LVEQIYRCKSDLAIIWIVDFEICWWKKDLAIIPVLPVRDQCVLGEELG